MAGVTCPACNKAGQTQTACARCGCDLTLLFSVLAAATAALAQARRRLQAADWPGALDGAARSWRLCHSVESARLAFLAATGLRQTQAALEWRSRAKRAKQRLSVRD